MTVEQINVLAGRDLDAAIAEHVLGWTPYRVPPGADGECECEILAPPGWQPGAFQFPPLGILAWTYLVPTYHSSLDRAIRLAQDRGLQSVRIDAPIRELPTMILRQVLREAVASQRRED